MRKAIALLVLVVIAALFGGLAAQGPARSGSGAEKWVASWVGSAHGPYPSGNAVAQPELKFAFPAPAADANDQTFRLIVRPDLWGNRWRIRLSNTFGAKPVTFDGIYLGI